MGRSRLFNGDNNVVECDTDTVKEKKQEVPILHPARKTMETKEREPDTVKNRRPRDGEYPRARAKTPRSGGAPECHMTKDDHAERTIEALLESEGKFRDLTEKSLVGVYLIQDDVFKYVNPRFTEIHGYDAEEIVNVLSPESLVVPEDWPAVRKNLQDRTTGKVASVHHQFREVTKTGKVITVEVYGSRTLYQGRTAIIGTLLDVTERKRAEDELRRLNEFNTALIDNAPIAIFTLNKEGSFTSINPAAVEILRLEADVVRSIQEFNWVSNRYTVKCGLAAHIRKGLKGRTVQLWDFPYVTYTGDRTLYMDFKGVPLKGKDGAIEGLLCIVEETTARVRTRAKLMQETRMAALGKLAAGIAHELNNPLATLVAHSELVCRRLDSQFAQLGSPQLGELWDDLKMIEEQAFRCKHVTSDILNLPWREGLAITEVDVNRLVGNVLKFTSNTEAVKFVRDLAPSLPYAKADIGALRQIIVNLVSNALDAVEGRIEPTVRIGTRLDDNRVILEVEDNGVGIPDSIIDKVFEPFFTTKESQKGIGLGLSLCHEFLSNMGGTISATSTPGQGATFAITLPTEDAR
jgi:PAS domain S-box-containing protein